MPREFTLPDLGEGIAEAQVVRVLIKAGDNVAMDQYLVEVETDKAAVEIPSPYAGVASKVHIEEGQTINVGDVVVTFDDAAAGGSETAKTASTASKAAPKAQKASPAPVASPTPVPAAPAMALATPASGRTKAPAAPVVRKMARELGLDLDSIAGSGPGGRILKEDLEQQLANRQPGEASPSRVAARRPIPAQAAPRLGIADTDKWGPIRREPLSQIRKTIANQMVRSVSSIPHVTHCDDVDITDLDKLRRNLNVATENDPKLTPLSFVVRAVCLALGKYPMFNSSFDDEGQQMIYKEYVNIGIAVDTERGLIVPVIRNADQLTLRGIAGELRNIAERIRTNKFAIEDLRGGTFTITNVGALGGTYTTPIINYPEVAILGLGRSRPTPVVKKGAIAESLILPLSLSFDHRATDGANAARFTREIASYLETPGRFLLD